MRAAIYARVSSAAQREAQTIENQLRVLPEYARRQGWKVVGTYTDDGHTAKSGHMAARLGLARLHADAAAKKFDVVLVVDMDRLTRSEDLIERASILGPFQRAGVQIATMSAGILDLDTTLGDFYASFQAAAAADWIRKHRERIMLGKDRAIAAGRKPAGPTPYGWRYDRHGAGWSLHDGESAIVREIFRRIAAGESCEALAVDFDARCIPRARSGRWERERVWQIVTNRSALGEWTADKARGLVIKIPAIVTEAEWQAANDALIKWGRRGLRRTKHVYLLEGIGVCELCGSAIHISSHGGVMRWGEIRKSPPTYVCTQRRRPARGTEKCLLPHRPVEEVDAMVWAKLADLFRRPAVLERALGLRGAEADQDRQTWEKDLRSAEASLVRLQRVEATILARFRKGTISESAMDTELKASKRERAMVERQVATARRAAASAERTLDHAVDVRSRLQELRRRLASPTPEIRRELVLALLGDEPIVVGATTIHATVRLAMGPAVAPADVGLALATG